MTNGIMVTTHIGRSDDVQRLPDRWRKPRASSTHAMTAWADIARGLCILVACSAAHRCCAASASPAALYTAMPFLANAASAKTGGGGHLEDPGQDFKDAVVPLIRVFIADNYELYGEGGVTFRMLKNHVIKNGAIGMTYEELSDDRYSAIMEDEIDDIVKRCKSGGLPVACVHAVGYNLAAQVSEASEL